MIPRYRAERKTPIINSDKIVYGYVITGDMYNDYNIYIVDYYVKNVDNGVEIKPETLEITLDGKRWDKVEIGDNKCG